MPSKDDQIDTTTGEVVPADAGATSLDANRVPRVVAEFLHDMETRDKATPDDVMVEIANRILSAESVDELWQADKIVGLQDLLAFPIRVDKVRFADSRYAEGLPTFCIIEGVTPTTGDPFVATCGAAKVVLMLYKLDKLGALPTTVQVTQTFTGNEGRAVLSMRPAPSS